jgi:hypothetical protein
MTTRELIRKARAFYPDSKHLRHAWVRAHLRFALVPKVSMGTLFNEQQLAPRERIWR